MSSDLEEKLLVNQMEVSQTEAGYTAVQEKKIHKIEAANSAFEIGAVVAGLIFSFAASLAADKSQKDSFVHPELAWPFHICIAGCIGFGLWSICVFSWIPYKAGRDLANERIEKAEKRNKDTACFRKAGKISFYSMMISFIIALCILYFDGLDWELAFMNSLILGVFVILSLITMIWTK